MSTSPTTPPYPTDLVGASGDAASTATYSPESQLDDAFNWLVNNGEGVGKWLHDTLGLSKIGEESLALFVKVLAFIPLELLKAEESLYTDWLKVLVGVVQTLLPPAEQFQETIGELLFPILQNLLQASAGTTLDFGSGALANFASEMMSEVVTRFSLINTAVDPSQEGAGVQNQQYLLRQALGVGIAQWVIDSMRGHIGFGVLNVFQPVLDLFFQTVNPMNAVREAMDASYAAYVRTPLTRDLNKKHLNKTLGLSSIARLYLRNLMTEEQYFDFLADAGLSPWWAAGLIQIEQKYLTESELGKLLNMGYLSETDAINTLTAMGYDNATANAKLYLATHSRAFSIMESVGNQAVTAWKRGYIDQPRLEQILQQMGYTDFEILLLEIEGEFTKTTTDTKDLSYTQVRDLYKNNLISITFVTDYLTTQGYQPDDVNRLILLDFTEAAEQEVRVATELARLRTQAALAEVQATEAAAKNEQGLADAKAALAKALDQAAGTLGELQTLAGISALLG